MPMQNKHPRTRPLLKTPSFYIAVFAVLLVVGVALYFLKFRSSAAPATSQETTSVASPSSKPSSAKTDTPEENSSLSSSDDLDDGKTPPAYEGNNANTFDSLTGVITYASVSGDKLLIRTNIDQYLSSGACALTLTNGTNTFSLSANIIPDASTSTCEGFDVPLSSLSAFSGETNIKITLTSGDKSGSLEGVVNL